VAVTDGREAVDRFARILEERLRARSSEFQSRGAYSSELEVDRVQAYALAAALDETADVVRDARAQFLAETAPKEGM